jgi:hypothetical protein
MTANILPALQAMAVPIETLHPFEGNPHRGDVDSIARSLAQLGQHRPVVVDAEGRVIVGNHTLLAARQLGWTEIAAIVTDDDDVTAQARLLADNRTSELGTNDDSDLLAMLLRVTSADTELLAAASYGTSDLIELLSAQPEPFLIEQENGSDQSGDLNATYAIVVTCTDEMHQLELVERFMAEGLACRVLIN